MCVWDFHAYVYIHMSHNMYCIFIVCSFLMKISVLFDCCTFRQLWRWAPSCAKSRGGSFFGTIWWILKSQGSYQIAPKISRIYFSWYLFVYIIRLLFKSSTSMFHCRFVVPHFGKYDFCFWCCMGTGVVVEILDQTGNPTEDYPQKAYNKFYAPLANTAVGNGM